ncbi:MAG: HAD family hydrolase [Povalibacter sp.]
MRYLCLCTDYDGTLAHHGKVDEVTLDALKRLRESGRKLVMVTGREIDDLQTVFEPLALFDLIVAENGAMIYRPATREERLLGEAPPPEFVAELRHRGVERLSVGRRIVATWEPYEHIVLQTIHDLGLELQVIFNKGAVMILPTGINKATGLTAALDELNLVASSAIGVGDAENDHAFLRLCGCSAAVANALPALKAEADIILSRDHGGGVTELIDELIENDLATRESLVARSRVQAEAGQRTV